MSEECEVLAKEAVENGVEEWKTRLAEELSVEKEEREDCQAELEDYYKKRARVEKIDKWLVEGETLVKKCKTAVEEEEDDPLSMFREIFDPKPEPKFEPNPVVECCDLSVKPGPPLSLSELTLRGKEYEVAYCGWYFDVQNVHVIAAFPKVNDEIAKEIYVYALKRMGSKLRYITFYKGERYNTLGDLRKIV